MVLVVVFIVASILIDFFKTREELTQEKLQVTKEVKQLFESETARLVSFLQTRVKCHLASPLAIQALESKDRELTYKVAKSKLEILQKNNPFITHMHFYLPDGTSLLRVHNKDVYGDKISDKRPMVAHAVQTQASVSGFEEGYFGLIFRIIEPAYNENGDYVGSLEFGLQPEYFESILKELFPGMKVTMAISKDNLRLYQNNGHFQSYNNHYLIGEDAELLKTFIGKKLTKSERTVKVNHSNHVLISDIALNDFAGNQFIQLYLLRDVQYLEDKFIQALSFSIFLGISSLLLLFLSARFVLNYLTDQAIQLSHKLTESHSKMQSVFNTSKEGLAIVTPQGHLIETNQAFSDITERSREQLTSTNWHELFNANQIKIQRQKLDVIDFTTPKNNHKTLEIIIEKLPNQELFLVDCRDITLLRKQQIDIENYIKVVDDNVIISKTDLNGIITYASTAFCRVSGHSLEELIGKNHSIVRHPDMSPETYKNLWNTISTGNVWQGEILNRKKNSDDYWVSATIAPDYDQNNQLVGYTAIRQDITDRKKVEELSVTDELTLLYNRRHYNAAFAAEFARRKREDFPFLYILMDLDNFKLYNDNYGHQKGDEVLIAFAQCLRDCFKRAGDQLFRMGGEEFAAILQIKEESEANHLVNKVNARLKELNIEHIHNKPSKIITASIGACLIVDYSLNLSEQKIYRIADKCLYQAKEEGRNSAILKVIGKD